MTTRPSLELKNALLPGGRIADILVNDGKVSHIGAGGTAERTIDCTGLLILPAAVDIHVHMRGGSQAAKEDWLSGSRSALAGGVTVVVDQPNTIPPLTTPHAFAARVQDAQTHSLCSFGINSGVTPDTPFAAMWQAGAIAFGETFFAPSSYGDAIGADALTRALGQIQHLGALATIHAEEVTPGADENLTLHAQLRSAAGELRAVHAVQQCNTSRCRLHFCHMSTGAAVSAATGTVEVTPHHLFLSHEMFADDDTFAKMNPPLRRENERKELWAQWNRIDIIASDHAPHTRPEKTVPFPSAPSGIPGVETMMPLLVAEALTGKISLADLVKKTSQAPAALTGIPPAGFSPGDRADFALYPREIGRVDPDLLHSRCRWSPFEGLPAVFPTTVVMGGDVVFDQGQYHHGCPVWYPGMGHSRT
jgi:dihydroorotase